LFAVYLSIPPALAAKRPVNAALYASVHTSSRSSRDIIGPHVPDWPNPTKKPGSFPPGFVVAAEQKKSRPVFTTEAGATLC